MNEGQLGDDQGRCFESHRHQRTTTSTVTSPHNSVKNDKKKKFIIPKIFTSKRRVKGGSDDDYVSPDHDRVSADLEKTITSRRKEFLEASSFRRKGFSEREESGDLIEGLNLSNFDCSMASVTEIQDFRIFVATWNVGGKTPNSDMNLEDFLLMEGSADIYVCGFQEIVPLNAGNVLVTEDNEPAEKWLALINQALNKPYHNSMYSCPDSSHGSKNSINNILKESKSPTNLHIFHKPTLKVLRKNFRACSSLLKTCNCPVDFTDRENGRKKKLRDITSKLDLGPLPLCRDSTVDELLALSNMSPPCSTGEMGYRLIARKQMVGIFLSVWARKELVPYIAHLRISSVGRGIMGRLGNKINQMLLMPSKMLTLNFLQPSNTCLVAKKSCICIVGETIKAYSIGCIALSMSLHQTSFCLVCSHLASGEKEGDELKRNADVTEILKGIQFPKICKTPNHRAPQKIIEHDRVIWLGDLNYRVALSYERTRILLEDNNWDTLLENDQLNMEREAGRVFNGFKEGRILFAPTYKYSHNSDSYAGETVKSKKKRRTPAWCDRILWHGAGIEQLSYIRGESRFSDHRPVSAFFSVEVEVRRKFDNRFRKGYSCGVKRLEYEDCIPQRRHSFYEF